MTTMQWTFHPRPTAIHAAAGLDAGLVPVDTDLAAAIAKPLVAAVDRLRGLNVDRAWFWQQLIVALASTDPIAQIVTTAIHRTAGPLRQGPMIQAELSNLISTMTQQAAPCLVNRQELELRSQPLQVQWQACGPGLLHMIAAATDQNLVVDHARVIFVQAVFGGGGSAHLHANAAHIEAMMVNRDESLPEVLRLVWMISQLKNDLPIYSEPVNRWRLPTVSGLAMLPATLEAATELRLATFNRQLLEHAMRAWHVLDGDVTLAAEIVETWWHTARSGGYTWSAALQALDRMIQPLYSALR